MLSLNKILTEFNELSSSSTVTFPLPFLHLFIHLHSFPPPPPTTSLHLPRSVSHSESTSVPPSFSPTSPSKTTAIPERGPSIFFSETRVRESAKATADYYLSLPPTQHMQKEKMDRQRGREGLKRVKETILDIKRTHQIVKAEACRVKKHSG